MQFNCIRSKQFHTWNVVDCLNLSILLYSYLKKIDSWIFFVIMSWAGAMSVFLMYCRYLGMKFVPGYEVCTRAWSFIPSSKCKERSLPQVKNCLPKYEVLVVLVKNWPRVNSLNQKGLRKDRNSIQFRLQTFTPWCTPNILKNIDYMWVVVIDLGFITSVDLLWHLSVFLLIR
jgi:hypothetical protein